MKWYDGGPFTAADMVSSILDVVRKTHPRGRDTYAHLEDIKPPDDTAAILKLAKPSPVICAAALRPRGEDRE